jgi:hypothetical protein
MAATEAIARAVDEAKRIRVLFPKRGIYPAALLIDFDSFGIIYLIDLLDTKLRVV